MLPHAPFPDQKNIYDFDREIHGVFRVRQTPEPLADSVYESPGLSGMVCCTSRPVRWLWPGKIPLGKLTLIEGPPAAGKLFVALDIAARMSTAEAWPDGAVEVVADAASIDVPFVPPARQAKCKILRTTSRQAERSRVV